jgi:glucose-6-phosphate dehydrogenase assembly protein OpcA
MIVTLKDTSTREISSRLETLHIHRGEAAQGRVLTLLIVCPQDALESALRTANETSWEHPCRVIAIVPGFSKPVTEGNDSDSSADSSGLEVVHAEGDKPVTAFRQDSRLDAEIRFGADAGASEIIVLRPEGELVDHLNTLVIPLIVADTPVVVWWPSVPPTNPSKDPLGQMAAVRITDASTTPDPMSTFRALCTTATPQDVDLAWTHLTLWRAQIMSMLDQQPHSPVISAEITGHNGNLSVLLMAGWISTEAHIPVTVVWDSNAEGLQEVRIHCQGGDFDLSRCAKSNSTSGTSDEQAWMTTPNSTTPQMVSLPHRTRTECLSEELGRLYPDKVWAKVVKSDFSFSQKFVKSQDSQK